MRSVTHAEFVKVLAVTTCVTRSVGLHNNEQSTELTSTKWRMM